MELTHKLPIGIHDFEKIREEQYLYVDKTAAVHELVQGGSGYFLCRPRCFGKSLLVSTVEAYFKGRRDLFEGLAMEALEQDWKEHLVMRLDLSCEVYTEEGTLARVLAAFLSGYEEAYGLSQEKLPLPLRFGRIIRRAYEETSRPVVVLVDDYDKPVLDALFSPAEAPNRELLRSFLSALGANDFYLKFVLVTGISKFASVNVFSGENKFRDISLYPRFSALCGFSGKELDSLLSVELPEGAGHVAGRLRGTYRGYRFGAGEEAVYNPFSVLCALDSNRAEDFASGTERRQFWMQTGQPPMLIKMMFSHHCSLFDLLYGTCVPADELMEYRWTEEDLLPLVYQAGYLSVAGQEEGLLRLAPPNAEVREGICRNLLSFVTGIGSTSRCGAEVAALGEALRSGDVAAFVSRFSAAVKDAPLLRQKKEPPETVARLAFHAVAALIGSAEKDSPADVLLRVPRKDGTEACYVFCLKMEKNLALEDVFADAFARMEEKRYASRLALSAGLDGPSACRRVAVAFSSLTGEVAGWKEQA